VSVYQTCGCIVGVRTSVGSWLWSANLVCWLLTSSRAHISSSAEWSVFCLLLGVEELPSARCVFSVRLVTHCLHSSVVTYRQADYFVEYLEISGNSTDVREKFGNWLTIRELTKSWGNCQKRNLSGKAVYCYLSIRHEGRYQLSLVGDILFTMATSRGDCLECPSPKWPSNVSSGT